MTESQIELLILDMCHKLQDLLAAHVHDKGSRYRLSVVALIPGHDDSSIVVKEAADGGISVSVGDDVPLRRHDDCDRVVAHLGGEFLVVRPKS